jgi:nicotinate-nucleotide adenylyltransferase
LTQAAPQAGLRIGIFGGTFDPPHIGHLILAEEAYHQLNLDRVLWVLTPDPPHKAGQDISPAADRKVLTLAAIAGSPGFMLSPVDLERPPPHFAADTLELLRDSPSATTWVYLMGADSLASLPDWHQPERFIALCDEIAVMARPGVKPDLEQLEAQLPGLVAKVRMMQVPLLDIQASEIRNRIRKGGAYRYYLPKAVFDLIRAEALYS